MALTAEDKKEILEMLAASQKELGNIVQSLTEHAETSEHDKSAEKEGKEGKEENSSAHSAEQWYREQLAKAMEINQQLAIHTNLGQAQKTPDDMLTEMFKKDGV